MLAWMISRSTKGATNKDRADNGGLLLASGLITGEALMGIFIAIAIVMGFQPLTSLNVEMVYNYGGLALLIGIVWFIYKVVTNLARKD
jgi:hypothetical protein